MQQIDFKGLSTELKKLVVETRMRLDGVDFKGLADQWKKTGESIDKLASSPDTIHSLENLNKTLEPLRTTRSGTWTRRWTPTARSSRRRSSRPRRRSSPSTAAAQSARGFINAQQNFGSDTSRALERVADAAESVQQLADFIERNPNALVSGRKEPK
jgi:paraquat-inducible protein B